MYTHNAIKKLVIYLVFCVGFVTETRAIEVFGNLNNIQTRLAGAHVCIATVSFLIDFNHDSSGQHWNECSKSILDAYFTGTVFLFTSCLNRYGMSTEFQGFVHGGLLLLFYLRPLSNDSLKPAILKEKRNFFQHVAFLNHLVFTVRLFAKAQ